MRIAFRVDGNPLIGGGHLMRCLTLADAARAQGHEILFLSVEGPDYFTDLIAARNYSYLGLTPSKPPPVPEASDPPHAGWRALPWQADAAHCATALRDWLADWLVLDHYGLDARWVTACRALCPDLRVLAIDDLDDRPLAADLLLDQGNLTEKTYRFPVVSLLRGPDYALLKPDFARLRDKALRRRNGQVKAVLIAPGMGDAAFLAPTALAALDAFPQLSVTITMSWISPSRASVEQRLASRPQARLQLDSPDMARLIRDADLAIGAGGMSAWERCCLGLPSLLVPVAENQQQSAAALATAQAVRLVSNDSAVIRKGLADCLANPQSLQAMARAAAKLVDGQGADRVVEALIKHS